MNEQEDIKWMKDYNKQCKNYSKKIIDKCILCGNKNQNGLRTSCPVKNHIDYVKFMRGYFCPTSITINEKCKISNRMHHSGCEVILCQSRIECRKKQYAIQKEEVQK